jgi:glycosyltransferase involved in cell wall biosynthesis
MPAGGPRHPEIGIVGLVTDAWTPDYWMARHHILTRLGAWFHVVWLARPLSWRDAWRPGAGARARTGTSSAPGQPPGFTIFHPGRWLPAIHRPAALNAWLGRARLRLAVRSLRRRGARDIVYYLWRPSFAWALDVPGARGAIYHVVDEYTFSPDDPPVTPQEAALLRAVDRVIVHSPALYEKRGGYNPATSVIPNGVHYAAFATPRPVPAELARIPRPRIGYVGILKKTLDLPLLLALAQRHPGWSFVFLGLNHLPPDAAAALRRQPNVHLLDPQPHSQLPAYVQHMDVCILPYVLDAYTKYIYPLKLHEYLAAGRPVVATPIRSLLEHEGTITLARTVNEWSAALAAAIAAAPDPAGAQARQAVARAHDWDDLVGRIARLVLDIVPAHRPAVPFPVLAGGHAG